MNRLGDTSAFVIPAGQLLLDWRGKTRMYTVGIVFEFYTVPLLVIAVDTLNQLQVKQELALHITLTNRYYPFPSSTI